MKVRGLLVEWLVVLNTALYENKVVYENGCKVLYLEILRAVYGMLIASILWYRKLKNDLEDQGFVFNPYDACVANRTYHGKQQTVRFHVDDLLCSCEDPKANDDLLEWAQSEYG